MEGKEYKKKTTDLSRVTDKLYHIMTSTSPWLDQASNQTHDHISILLMHIDIYWNKEITHTLPHNSEL
jgi:hypothetical protein